MDSLWEKLERDIELLTHGVATPASGRLGQKGDVQTSDLLIECKHRTHKGPNYAATIQKDWCDTVKQHAEDVEKIPLLVCGLTWTREYQIDARIILCLVADLENFTKQPEIFPYLHLPEGWTAITTESVQEYCNREIKQLRAAVASKSAHTFGKRSLLTSRPMSSRPSGFRRK